MSKKFITTTLAAATLLSVSALPASQFLSQHTNTVKAADNDNSQFIQKIAPYAQTQAMKYGVYPSVMMAQAILESAWGTSALGQAPNYNLFGIKGAYQGQSVMMPTSEWDTNAGKYIQIQAPFRKYPDFGASFADNGDKLRNGLTTNRNFYNGTWIENTTSYQDSTKWLTGRYATSPTYNTNLNRVIQTYNLTRFDPQVTNITGQVQTKTSASLYNTYTGVKTQSNIATAGQVFNINQKVVLPDNSVYYRLTNNLWVSDQDVTSNISQGPNGGNTTSNQTTNVDKAQSFSAFSKGAQLNNSISGYQLSSDNTFNASKQLTSQHVQLTTKAVTTQGVTYYLSSTNGVWIKASDLTLDKDQVSQAPENPVNKTAITTKDITVQDNYNIYSLKDNTFNLSNNTNAFESKDLKITQKATQGDRTYFLLSSDGQNELGWIDQTGVTDRKVEQPKEEQKQPEKTQITTQDVTPQKVTVNTSATNYYLMSNGFVNAGEKLSTNMTVIKTATKGSTQYSLLSNDGKTPLAWVESSAVKTANSIQQPTTDNNKVTTQDVTAQQVSVNTGATNYYLMNNGFVNAGEKLSANMTVIKTATKGSTQYSLLSNDGKTPVAWVESSAVKASSSQTSTSDSKVTIKTVTPQTIKLASGYNTYYLLSNGFTRFGNTTDLGNAQYQVIQTATQGNKNYSLLSQDGKSGLAWVSSEAVSDLTSQPTTNTGSAGITLTNVSKSASVVNGGSAYYLINKSGSLTLVDAGKSGSYVGSTQVIKQATQNGKNYYLISKDGQTGLAWIDEAGIYFGASNNTQSNIKVEKADGQPVWIQQTNPMYQLRNNTFEQIQGNGSAANDSYFLIETAKVGQTTYYHVSKDGVNGDFWTTTLKFQSGRFTNPIDVVGVATINYIPGYGVRIWDQDQKPTDKFLKHGTQWRIFGEAHSEDKTYYQVGTNQWVDGQYVQLSNYQRYN